MWRRRWSRSRKRPRRPRLEEDGKVECGKCDTGDNLFLVLAVETPNLQMYYSPLIS